MSPDLTTVLSTYLHLVVTALLAVAATFFLLQLSSIPPACFSGAEH